MRKRKKEEILEIIETLRSAIVELENLMTDHKGEAALELLTECQNVAIAVGNAIEESEQTETRAVHLLEDLCEMIYSCASAETEQGQLKYCEQMAQKLVQIQDEIQSGIKTQKLAVFLPYKASMWDSLESVWRASKEDDEWISIVMPIPYFGKNEDGTLGEMQYEGNDFPADVPITDWQQFSLEKEHPDIIFIHNPYDQYNFVTTIHPMFYSSKIREYTDKLVYIPYFVHQNDIVSDTYCVLPGTIYADVVVLQSEKVREQYIHYFEAAFPEYVEKKGRQAIKDKFQALGSPKFDAGNDNISEIPTEWKNLLGDGRRKVIFLNTHISGLMEGKSERFFKKMEWIFRFFEKRDDVVLLWRPHPLALDTARSMNPAAVEPYLKLVEKYKESGMGIYDDSKDLHRAVNLADAYYGDASSVTELFRQQRKPVMIMDYDVTTE